MNLRGKDYTIDGFYGLVQMIDLHTQKILAIGYMKKKQCNTLASFIIDLARVQ